MRPSSVEGDPFCEFPVYADSIFLAAPKVRRDTFHETAVSFYERRQEKAWLWSPWQRIEVFNTIRQLARQPDIKRRLLLAEAGAVIHGLETERSLLKLLTAVHSL